MSHRNLHQLIVTLTPELYNPFARNPLKTKDLPAKTLNISLRGFHKQKLISCIVKPVGKIYDTSLKTNTNLTSRRFDERHSEPAHMEHLNREKIQDEDLSAGWRAKSIVFLASATYFDKIKSFHGRRKLELDQKEESVVIC